VPLGAQSTLAPHVPDGPEEVSNVSWSPLFVGDLVWRAIAGSIATCQSKLVCAAVTLDRRSTSATHVPEGTQGWRGQAERREGFKITPTHPQVLRLPENLYEGLSVVHTTTYFTYLETSPASGCRRCNAEVGSVT
jgi:hypothetical protein